MSLFSTLNPEIEVIVGAGIGEAKQKPVLDDFGDGRRINSEEVEAPGSLVPISMVAALGVEDHVTLVLALVIPRWELEYLQRKA